MGAYTNRMLPRPVTVDNAAESTIVGVGFEGVLNAASSMSVTVDGSGGTVRGVVVKATLGIVTVRTYYVTTPGAVPVADAVVVAVPAGGTAIIGIDPPNTSVYQVILTAQTAAGAPEDMIVSSLATMRS